MDRQEKIDSLYRQRDKLLLLSIPGLIWLTPGFIWFMSNLDDLLYHPSPENVQIITSKVIFPFLTAYLPFKTAEYKHLEIKNTLGPNDVLKRDGLVETVMDKLIR